MGRNLSPVLRRELENLEKDPDSRKSAMKALKSYVKDLDTKAIPVFLAKVSETKETGSLSGEFTISLYEILARSQGVKIVPMIDTIMGSIVKTLASSAGSFPLHQACSKVVPAIARYGMDHNTPEDKKTQIIYSLCKPLSDSLSSSQESLTCGAALCLKALVDADNWRYASDEIVNMVCQNVAVALGGKSTQKNSHMGLVMALAKRNALIVEAYARLLIQSGLRILNAGLMEGNSSHKRLSAIQMVNFLMKFLDPISIYSEIDLIIEEMEKCQSDEMAYVKGAAFEALQTAKRIAMEKKPRYVASSPVSVTGSNFSSRRNYYLEGENVSGGDHSPRSVSQSPESHTLGFFINGYESSVVESPISTCQQYSPNLDYERRSVSRKLWSHQNGGVDVSLKDGLSLKVGQDSSLWENSACNEFPNGSGDLSQEFAGFSPRNDVRHRVSSTTTSPQKSHTQVTTLDSIKIFKTPRKLIHSLQDPHDDVTSDFYEKQNNTRLYSGGSNSIQWSPTSEYDKNGSTDNVNSDFKENEESDVDFQDGSESVSSTNDLPEEDATSMQMPPSNVVPESKNVPQTYGIGRTLQKTKFKLVCGFSFLLLAMATPLIWISSQDEGHYLVPT